VDFPREKGDIAAVVFRALRHRDFAALCAGAFVSNIGIWMERVAVGIWVTQKTGQASWTGAVTAMIFLPVAFLGPLGGALADRYPRRGWLITFSLLQATIAGLLASLAALGQLSVGLMAGLMFLTGCAAVLLNSAFNALITQLVPREDLTSAMFLNSGQWNLARIVGPLLAAPAIAFGKVTLAFWLNTGSFVAVLAAVAWMRIPPHTPHPSHREPIWQGLRSGVALVRADEGISSALWLTALAGLFIAPFIGLVPAFALQTLREGPAQASLLVTAQGLGAVASAVLSARWLDRVGAAQWLKWASFSLCLLGGVYWLAPTFGWAMLAMLALGAVYLSVITAANRVCLGRAPAGRQAWVASLFHSTLDTSYAVGLIAMGALADAFGLRETGVAFAAVCALTLWMLRRARTRLFVSLQT
jgi:MFS family permease